MNCVDCSDSSAFSLNDRKRPITERGAGGWELQGAAVEMAARADRVDCCTQTPDLSSHLNLFFILVFIITLFRAKSF